MKLGILISQTEPETVWNAFRLGNFSLGKQHEVKVFFIGKGVDCESIDNIKFNVKQEISKFLENGGNIYACGTCLKSRALEGSQACPMSSMQDLMDIVEESEKLISF